MKSNMLEQLLEHKIIAILRGVEAAYAIPTGQALIDGGIKLMEITMNTPGAVQMIEQWRTAFDDKAFVGAGTVIDMDHAREAVAAGAQFMISPNLDKEVIAYGHQHGVPVWPGVMTPTEIIQAIKAGAEAIKLFPMGTLGIQYLEEIRGPLNDIPIIATGGVRFDNISSYFAAGANAVGMGSKLIDLKLARNGEFDQIVAQVKQFTTLVKEL